MVEDGKHRGVTVSKCSVLEDRVLPQDELGGRHLIDQFGHVRELGLVPVVPDSIGQQHACTFTHVKNKIRKK